MLVEVPPMELQKYPLFVLDLVVQNVILQVSDV